MNDTKSKMNDLQSLRLSETHRDSEKQLFFENKSSRNKINDLYNKKSAKADFTNSESSKNKINESYNKCSERASNENDSSRIDLETIGWDLFFREKFEPYKIQGFIPGRITQSQRKNYIALTELGEINVKISGKFRFDKIEREAYPAVGDWVAIKQHENNTGIIQAILPRKSKFSRKVAGKTMEEQIIATNVDIVWIVSDLASDFNIQRIERYITLVSESGAKPIIILNKSDLCKDIDKKIKEIKAIARSVPVHVLSAELNQGLDTLNQYLVKGKTIALLGSSGTGKSTIINKLLGIDRQKIGSVRKSDGRGKHITTHREMIMVPNGGMIMDNPGMKEIQLWYKGNGSNNAFEDIEELSHNCKFKNCEHETEPGCAVKAAIENGELDTRRYQHYLKLRKEAQSRPIKHVQTFRTSSKRHTE